jgi:hypothetical protein
LGDVLQSYDPASKTLELELGDMKDHGMYRIVAVDNDLVSFVDARLPPSRHSSPLLFPDDKIQWPAKLPLDPVILITNPKDARFAMDTKEPLHRIRSSTHIRFLVFTDLPPDALVFYIRIDGVVMDDGTAPLFVGDEKQPLWVLPWDPSAYANGSHVLSIQVRTLNGLMGESSILFRTDGRRAKIGGGAGEWIISTRMSSIVSIRGAPPLFFWCLHTHSLLDSIAAPMYYTVVDCHHAYPASHPTILL